MTDTSTDEPAADEREAAPDDKSRRRLLRILIGLAIGIPVTIEVSTFFGMLSGDREVDAVDIGDELLPATPQTETLVDSSVYEGPPRQYELVAELTNTTEATTELTVGPLYTGDGNRVAGTVSREAAPGETVELTARWRLEADRMPEAVRARTAWGDDAVTERVALARPAVYPGTPSA